MVLWNLNLQMPVLKLVRSGHFKGLNFGGNGLEFILAFLPHTGPWKQLKHGLFLDDLSLQMETVHTQSRVHVCFFFFFFSKFLKDLGRQFVRCGQSGLCVSRERWVVLRLWRALWFQRLISGISKQWSCGHENILESRSEEILGLRIFIFLSKAVNMEGCPRVRDGAGGLLGSSGKAVLVLPGAKAAGSPSGLVRFLPGSVRCEL